MTRGILGTILWACLAACIGVGLFFVKHEVKDQEHRLTALNGEIQRNQETIHVLRAEWSYLNDPARLRQLSEKHLGMHPVMPNQVATLDSVLRNGLPGNTMMAAASPVRPSAQAPGAVPAPLARPGDQPVKAQPVKLVDNQSRPRPMDLGKPGTPKPPPAKPGTVATASAAPPPSLVAPPPSLVAPPTVSVPPAPGPARAVSAATTPAHGGRSIVIQSPALAQTDGGGR